MWIYCDISMGAKRRPWKLDIRFDSIVFLYHRHAFRIK